MDIPSFPLPPAPIPRSAIARHHRDEDSTEGDARAAALHQRRRPRSASWLVTRRQQARHGRRRNNHVLPFAVAPEPAGRRHHYHHHQRSSRKQFAAELTLTMTESRCPRDEEEEDGGGGEKRDAEVLERIRECSRSPNTIKEDQVDEAEIICCASAEATAEPIHPANPAILNTINERLAPPNQPLEDEESPPQRNNVAPTTMLQQQQQPKGVRSTAVQTIDRVLYRLRVFPTLKDIVDEENKPPDPKKRGSRILRYFRFLGRVAMCQFGLTWLLTLWAILGAGAFYVTEGPRERQQVVDLKDMQRDLAVGLATELRQLRADEQEMEPLWSKKVQQYVARHEKLLLIAVSSGYGEGGDNGQLWTFSGCMLFAISVLTTLGFGAPVPRTNAGRTVAVVFAAIGIPAHFVLVLNLGLMLAMRFKRYGIAKKYPEVAQDPETIDVMPMPMWIKIVPFAAIAVYYVIGILGFGAGRQRPFSDSLLFPLDFTAAGGLSTTAGYVRILYGVYLEGAVTLAAIAVAVLKVSATQSLTNVGLKFGLLVPA